MIKAIDEGSSGNGPGAFGGGGGGAPGGGVPVGDGPGGGPGGGPGMELPDDGGASVCRFWRARTPAVPCTATKKDDRDVEVDVWVELGSIIVVERAIVKDIVLGELIEPVGIVTAVEVLEGGDDACPPAGVTVTSDEEAGPRIDGNKLAVEVGICKIASKEEIKDGCADAPRFDWVSNESRLEIWLSPGGE